MTDAPKPNAKLIAVIQALDAWIDSRGEEEGEPEFNREQYDNIATEALVRHLDRAQKRHDGAKLLGKLMTAVHDYLRITKVPAAFEDAGIDNIKIAGVGRVSLTADMHVSIAASKKADALQWFDDSGRGALVERSVNPSTLKAVIKKLMVEGKEELPPDVFNVNPFTRASLTRKGI